MPRRMPPLVDQFVRSIDRAMSLVDSVEQAKNLLSTNAASSRLLHPRHLENVYELAYIRMFIAWEEFLEQSCYRYLCGYTCSNGQQALAGTTTYQRTISLAEAYILGGRGYKLWHNPQQVINRVAGLFHTGLHEQVLRSNQTRLEQLASIRHRIAHSQSHAKTEFDITTMSIAGRRYLGGRPGRFLRDWDTSVTPSQRWIETFGNELKGLAHQIVP